MLFAYSAYFCFYCLILQAPLCIKIIHSQYKQPVSEHINSVKLLACICCNENIVTTAACNNITLRLPVQPCAISTARQERASSLPRFNACVPSIDLLVLAHSSSGGSYITPGAKCPANSIDHRLLSSVCDIDQTRSKRDCLSHLSSSVFQFYIKMTKQISLRRNTDRFPVCF